CPAPPGAMCSTRPIWCRAHSPRHSWKGWKGRRTVCPEFAWNSPDRGPPIRSPVRNPLWGRGRDRRRTPGDRPGGPARPAAGRRGRHHRRHHPAHRGRGSRPDRSERAHQLGQRERPVTLRAAALTGPPHDEQQGGRPHRGRRPRMDLEPDTVERDLVKLVLTVVELLRQLMERQALRRFDVGDLTEEQEERVGLTLMLLEERMTELRERYGLRPEDLNLDLGPLGPLLPRD